jgi:hypothetical protein
LVTHHPQLTSSEIGFLWAAYMEDTAESCILKHFISVMEDAEARPILEFALSAAEQHVSWIRDLFTKEGIPVPDGFGSQDWNPNAQRLYSDLFALGYIKHLATMGSAGHTMAHSLSTRPDVRRFFRESTNGSSELFDRTVDYMLSKGFYVRPPSMNYPSKVEYVKKQGFLSNVIGGHRPLLSIEICHLSKAVETNKIGGALLLGFGQVAKSKAVREHMARGQAIANKHIQLFQELILADGLPSPSTSDGAVSASTVSTFSDKLILFTVNSISALGIVNYGAALAVTMRADLASRYARLQAETMLYAEDGVNLMIENQWLEQPPQVTDHNALLKGEIST